MNKHNLSSILTLRPIAKFSIFFKLVYAWQASMSGLIKHAEIPAAAILNGLSSLNSFSFLGR